MSVYNCQLLSIPLLICFLFKKRKPVIIKNIGAANLNIVGIIVEYVVFANLEKHTVRKWGMIR